jgi:hypothetical protein
MGSMMGASMMLWGPLMMVFPALLVLIVVSLVVHAQRGQPFPSRGFLDRSRRRPADPTHVVDASARCLVFDTTTTNTIRAADVDRESVSAALTEHLASGRLSLEEFDERVRRAHTATTLGELRALLADLPSPTTR